MYNCIYCGDVATTRDHFIPWTYNHVGKRKETVGTGKKIDGKNIVPACLECNSMAGNKVFETIEKKREYIQERIEIKYKKIIRIPDWSENELKELGRKLMKDTRLKMLAKQWVINRIAYPTVIYPIEPIRQEMRKILALF